MTQEAASQVKRRHADRLMSLPGVIGVGVEKEEHGGFVLVVHLNPCEPGAEPSIPNEIDDCPVKLVRSGPFRKQSCNR